MTAARRLAGVRRTLLGALLLRALLLGATAGAAAFLLLRLATLGSIPAIVGVIVGATVAALAARPALRARSTETVALWIEERHPSLAYALVTAAGGPTSEAVEWQALSLPWWSSSRHAIVRRLAGPAVAAASMTALLVLLPPPTGLSATRPSGGAPVVGEATARDVDLLARIRVTVDPPAYAGRARTSSDDPTSVEALVGSRVTISGEGDARLVTATLDSLARPTTAEEGGRWSVTVAMPLRPALVRLGARGGTRARLLVLAPVADAPPGVVLLLPVRDTVVRRATGVLALRAQLRDDIGLRDARFELVISSGEGENFTFRSAVIAPVRLAGAAHRVLDARLPLDSLALQPGDVLQLRAVARDGNSATGPGVGSSDTRSLRVARAGEYDSVSVDPAPPGEPEAQVLSQRMLINLTQALDRRRPRLERGVLLAESRRIATDQAKLRKRVGDIVFQRVGGEPLEEHADHAGHEEHALPAGKLTPEALLKLAEQATQGVAGAAMEVEGDETPILAVNKPLLEAFNAMWDAGRALEQGETDRALPPMRRALAAIERARQAERIYLRGRPAAVVIDIAKARLAGKDKGASTVREPRPPADPVVRRRAAAFARATALLARDAGAAADTLLVMRVEALGSAPALAAALEEAARVARRGDTAAIALAWQRVRRSLGPQPRRGDASALWGGAP